MNSSPPNPNARPPSLLKSLIGGVVGVTGLLSTAFFTFLVAYFIDQSLFGAVSEIGLNVGITAFSGILLIASLAMVFFGFRPLMRSQSKQLGASQHQQMQAQQGAQLQSDTAARHEKTLLHLARLNHGRLSPSLVAVQSEMSIRQARAGLDHMLHEGVAELEPTANTEMTYLFPSFLVEETTSLDFQDADTEFEFEQAEATHQSQKGRGQGWDS